jgi:hypothetical protein
LAGAILEARSIYISGIAGSDDGVTGYNHNPR